MWAVWLRGPRLVDWIGYLCLLVAMLAVGVGGL